MRAQPEDRSLVQADEHVGGTGPAPTAGTLYADGDALNLIFDRFARAESLSGSIFTLRLPGFEPRAPD